jgi:hypothetical protein
MIFIRDRADVYVYYSLQPSLISRELYVPNDHRTLYSFCEFNRILCAIQRNTPPWFKHKTRTKAGIPVYDILHINFITVKWPRLRRVHCVESGLGGDIKLCSKVEREEHQLTETDYSGGHFSYIFTVSQRRIRTGSFRQPHCDFYCGRTGAFRQE